MGKHDDAVIAGADYERFITALKSRIQAARISASRVVYREMILLYWDIGHSIVEKQKSLGWGESVVEQTSKDLRRAFPEMTGLSPRNLRNMKQFYLAYADESIWQQVVAKLEKRQASAILQQAVAELGGRQVSSIRRQPVAKLGGRGVSAFLRQAVAEIPWGQNLHILNKVTEPAARLYYIQATARFGWSRNTLLNQIKAGAYEHALLERKTHNFPLALPEQLAGQAEEALKSSYSLGFLGVRREIKEQELENRLIERLREFILELGYGFCFVGRQHRLVLGQKEYFIDLLFYHRFIKALVAFELKVGPFKPEHAGKMDFYLNLLNEKERAPDDRPSIGIILCAEKDNLEVEFALKSKTNPIGVAEYHLQAELPAEFKGKLPTARQLMSVVRPILPRGDKV
jgi:predicted nuclease of restriction endonuclease-like (RecB) superfamily